MDSLVVEASNGGRSGFDDCCHQIPSEFTRIPCLNCGGGDRWCRYQSSVQEFQPANSSKLRPTTRRSSRP
ncbi:hypothetical protein TNCV_939051 [Trichonephila clavipes]|nr:hypothetical protein TNCV_939051 [Trichonephila clavipes]